MFRLCESKALEGASGHLSKSNKNIGTFEDLSNYVQNEMKAEDKDENFFINDNLLKLWFKIVIRKWITKQYIRDFYFEIFVWLIRQSPKTLLTHVLSFAQYTQLSGF